MSERHLDQCDNGCRRAAVTWTSEGYVCRRCANALDQRRGADAEPPREETMEDSHDGSVG